MLLHGTNLLTEVTIPAAGPTRMSERECVSRELKRKYDGKAYEDAYLCINADLVNFGCEWEDTFIGATGNEYARVDMREADRVYKVRFNALLFSLTLFKNMTIDFIVQSVSNSMIQGSLVSSHTVEIARSTLEMPGVDKLHYCEATRSYRTEDGRCEIKVGGVVRAKIFDVKDPTQGTISAWIPNTSDFGPL